jgi:4,5-dihydroxyphthalate decarboxylase
MARLPLTIATWDYDRVRAIADGRVPIEGCAINYLHPPLEEIFFRAFGNAEFDVSELSFSSYVISKARERDQGIPFAYHALPVFMSRVFRHSGIYVRADRGINAPKDLVGRIAGVPEYQMTAAVWIRCILKSEYGVAPSDLRWRNGGLEQPGRHEKIPLDLPKDVELKPIAEGKTLSAMLDAGEIDVLVSARAPSCHGRNPAVRRLFPNFREAERAYFKKTGIFPMMHVIGVRKTLLEAHPWLGVSLYKAFIEAKRLAMPELTEVGALKVMLPWVVQEAEDTVALMGRDWWPYGVRENKAALDAFLATHFDQGLSGKQPFQPEDIFVRSTFELSKL